MSTAIHRGLPWAAVVAGPVVLAVGVGLGPRHYAEDGLTGTALLGLALVVVGLVVAGWAGLRVLRGTRARWWLLTVPALLLATYVSLWTVGQGVAATYPPHPGLGDRTPADVGLDFREVSFRSGDGVELAGWYVPSRNGAAVALLHGAGEGMDFGWYGEADAAGAVDFLGDLPDVAPRRIGLVGLSMGGEQAIGAAGSDPRVAAVVADGATNRVAADKGFLAAYGVRGEVQQQVDRVTYAVVDLLTDAPRPTSLRHSVAVATGRPDPTAFLLVAAGRVDTEALAADFIAGDASGVQTRTVPGAGHTQGLRTAPDEWEERVVGFLDEALRD
jgi:hypothetical protein